ncbi:MAG: hypothetical protein L6425_09800 [Candidatus Aminicenantes bacterium]|nr:hypothetical protein [Candidatus Aminicenantes bacterium]
MMKKKDETLDTFFHGRIQVLQKKKGYRFALDAPLLSDFIKTTLTDHILELGTGSGIIPLLLSTKPFASLTALEIQPDLADMARRSVALNNLTDRITVFQADLRTYRPAECPGASDNPSASADPSDPNHRFDVILSNPPYIKARAGRTNDNPEIAAARHEVHCTLDDVMGRTAALLKDDGRAYFIFPERRRFEFLETAWSHGLRSVVEREVQPRAETSSVLFLSELRKHGYSQVVHPPLILYDDSGEWSREARRIFAGGPAPGRVRTSAHPTNENQFMV